MKRFSSLVLPAVVLVLLLLAGSMASASRPTVTFTPDIGNGNWTNVSPFGYTMTFDQPIYPVTMCGADGSGHVWLFDNVITWYSAVGYAQPKQGAIAVTNVTKADLDANKMFRTISISVYGNSDGIYSGTVNDSVTTNANLEPSVPSTVPAWIHYDTVSPNVTINRASSQSNPTTATTVHFTAEFSEPVTGLSSSGVVVSGSAHPNNVVVSDAPPYDHTIYDVAVSGMNSTGDVTAIIPQGVTSDAAGNTNMASTSSDNTVTVDSGFDVDVEETTVVPPATSTSLSTVHFTAKFTQKTYDFTAADVSLNGTAGASNISVSNVSGDHETYDIAVSGMQGNGTVIASIPPGVCHGDTVGSITYVNPASTSNNNTIVYTGYSPLASITKASNDPTNQQPIRFTVSFSEPVTPVNPNDPNNAVVSGTEFTNGNTPSVSITGSGATYNVAVSGMVKGTTGTVTLSIPAGKWADIWGNTNISSSSATSTITYDTVCPTVTINQASGQPDPTDHSPVNFVAIFSKPVTGLATGDVLIGGNTGANTAIVSGSGTTYYIAVTGMTQSGNVTVTVPPSVATDMVGNPNLASTSTDDSVTYLGLLYATISQPASQPDPTTGTPIHFTVSFTRPVTDFNSASVTVTGTAPGIKTVTPTTTDNQTFDVAVSGMTGPGTVVVNMNPGACHDQWGYGNQSPAITDNMVTFSPTNPTVTINQASDQPDPTNRGPIHFVATFSEPVVNFNSGCVALSPTTPAGSMVSVIPRSDGVSYDVYVSGMTTDGFVQVSIPAGAVNSVPNLPNLASTSTDNQVQYEISAPTVTLASTMASNPTNVSPITFHAKFSTPVVLANVRPQVSGTAGATSATVTGGPTDFNITVSNMKLPCPGGTVTVTLPAGIPDEAGNSTAQAVSATVNFDNVPPTVTLAKAADQVSPATGSQIHFTATFSEPVTFSGANVVLSGGAGATTAVVNDTGDHTHYDVFVSGMKNTGTVNATVNTGTVKDLAGNLNSTSSTATIIYNSGVPPTVTLSLAANQASPTNTLPIKLTAVFSAPISTFNPAAITATCVPSTAAATVTGVDSGDNKTFNITVTSVSAPSTVTVTLCAGAGKDAAGNESAPSNSVQAQYDAVAPTVTIDQAPAQPDPTKSSPINFKVVFSKPVTGFTDSGVSLTGTAGATTAVVTGSGATYNVAVSGMTQTGTVIATVKANAAKDSAGNSSQASTSTDNTVTYDVSPLSVTVDQASGQADPTSDSTVNFTVVFSKSVSDFNTSLVQVSGTAGGTKTIVVTGSGANYNVAVSGMTSTGTVIVDIPANAAHDSLGNANTKSTSTDNSVTFDNGAPVVTIVKPTSAVSCVRNCKQVSISGTASDDTKVTEVDWASASGSSGVCTGTTNWTASNLNIDGQDTITITAKDGAGNTSSSSLKITVNEQTPGSAWQGLCMVSLPIIPDDADPKNVVGFINNAWASYDTGTNQFSIYPDAATFFTPADQTPFRGFWARFGNTIGTPMGVIPDQTQPISIPLSAGWNLIGQPFISPVKWDLQAIKVSAGGQQKTLADACTAGWITDYAWGWSPDPSSSTGGQYYLVYDNSLIPTAVGELAPWRAYWIFANYDCQLILPAP